MTGKFCTFCKFWLELCNLTLSVIFGHFYVATLLLTGVKIDIFSFIHSFIHFSFTRCPEVNKASNSARSGKYLPRLHSRNAHTVLTYWSNPCFQLYTHIVNTVCNIMLIIPFENIDLTWAPWVSENQCNFETIKKFKLCFIMVVCKKINLEP